jgi:nicotinamide-nucleotide amidase
MKNAGIISVGTEIMRGKIDDTNSTFIARWLKDCGIKLKFRLSVEDEINDIVSAIKYIEECDLIILTGGLGPTKDDLTREALSKFLNKKLVFQENEWEKLKYFFNKYIKIPIADSNKQQVELIEGGEFLRNDNGTAPGMFCNVNNKIFILLPGPPKENQPMIKNYLFPKLKESGFITGDIYTRVFRLYNIGESTVADFFKDFNEEIEIGYYFTQTGWVEIHLSKFITTSDDLDKIQPIIKKAENILTDNKVFFTEDKDLSQLVLELLIKNNQTISFAESITGGNISGEFVKNPGSSKALLGSIVSYSNESKQKLLCVSEESLLKFGAVSEEVVKEMVIGLKKTIGSDICVSISGIAGPDGGTEQKPVGLVYFGFMFGDKLIVKKEIISGVRSRIIVRCINYVYVEILKWLNSK